MDILVFISQFVYATNNYFFKNVGRLDKWY